VEWRNIDPLNRLSRLVISSATIARYPVSSRPFGSLSIFVLPVQSQLQERVGGNPSTAAQYTTAAGLSTGNSEVVSWLDCRAGEWYKCSEHLLIPLRSELKLHTTDRILPQAVPIGVHTAASAARSRDVSLESFLSGSRERGSAVVMEITSSAGSMCR